MVDTPINHYKILEKIGQGSRGEGYRAQDTNLSREVAVKVLPVAGANLDGAAVGALFQPPIF